jgi:hypothetical protein
MAPSPKPPAILGWMAPIPIGAIRFRCPVVANAHGAQSGPSLERKERAMIYAALIIANVAFGVLMGLLIVPAH